MTGLRRAAAGVATRIINEVRRINRVVYGYTSERPGTIEWERDEANTALAAAYVLRGIFKSFEKNREMFT